MNGVPWATVQRMLADQPRYSSSDGSETVKRKDFLDQIKAIKEE